MIVERHTLTKDFPELKDRIHELKTTDNHFARLFKEYDEVDHTVVRMEEDVEPVCDKTLNEKRQQRLRLKDELYAMLTAK